MKKYLKPALDVEKFDVEDIITASTGGTAIVNPPSPPDEEGLAVVTVIDFN